MASKLTVRLHPTTAKEFSGEQVVNLHSEVRSLGPLLRQVLGPDVALEMQLQANCVAPINVVDFNRVLLNLVSNARDAMEGVGTLTRALFA